MKPITLRRIVRQYQRAHDIETFTETVAAFAKELPASSGAVWHWLAGERKIRPMVAERIQDIISL